MDLAKQSTLFRQRYYDWSVAEIVREVDADFERLRRLPNIQTIAAIKVLEGRDRTTRVEYLKAGLRSRLFGEAFPAHLLTVHSFVRRSLSDWGLNRPFMEREEAGEYVPVGSREMKKMVRAELEASFGPPVRVKEAYRFVANVRGQRLYTEVHFGPRDRRVAYWHTIHAGMERIDDKRSDDNLLGAHGWISMGLWLGIGDAAWNFVRPDDMPAVALTIRQWADYFVQAAADLLEGIDASP